MVLDAFPRNVQLPDGTIHYYARVVEHADEVHVFVWEDGVPVRVERAHLEQPVDGAREVRVLHTDRGAWAVTMSPDCGCRNPLKRRNKPHLMDLIVAP